MTDQATARLAKSLEARGWRLVHAYGHYSADRPHDGRIRLEVGATEAELLRLCDEFDSGMRLKAAPVPAAVTRSDDSSRNRPPLEPRIREGAIDSTGTIHRTVNTKQEDTPTVYLIQPTGGTR